MAVAKTIGSSLCICLLYGLLAGCGHEDYDFDDGLYGVDHEHDPAAAESVAEPEGEAPESDASQAVRTLSRTAIPSRVGVERGTVGGGGPPAYAPPTDF